MNRQIPTERIPARLDRRAVEAMADAGALDRLGRLELIDGVLIEMAPSRNAHGMAIMEIGIALAAMRSQGFRIGTDVGVFLRDDLMRAPDVTVVRADAPRGFLAGSDVVLLIEVSHTTLQEDLGAKAQHYAAAGIDDYWVVDLEGRRLHRHRQPQPDGYAEIEVVGWEVPVSPLAADNVMLDLADLLSDLPDEEA